jgi:superfamily II DNA or RNA helicase
MASERLMASLRHEAALRSTFERGQRLSRNGAVGTVDVREGSFGSTARLAAKVAGSRGASYRTTVDLDLESDEVLDYSCTCPAAANYRGMCKHEIALALNHMASTEPSGLTTRREEPPTPVLTPSFQFKIALENGEVTCEARVFYGEWTTSLGGPANVKGQPVRDRAAEYHAMNAVEIYFPRVRDRYVFDESDDELLFALLTRGLSALAQVGEVLLSERLRSINVRPAPNLSVRATVKSNLLDVELGATGMTKAELLEYLDGWKRRQGFVRLSTGDIVRIGENLKLAGKLAAGLGVSVEQLADGGEALPTSHALLVDELVKRAEGARLQGNASFRSLVRDMCDFSDADIRVPEGLCATLRGYQEDGFRWLGTLEHFGFGGILADDMGLGKTLQVIAHVLARKEAGDKGATLVVCPASLVYNWAAEFTRFAPTIDVVSLTQTKAKRETLIREARAHDVLITSYDLMRRDIKTLATQHFSRVVLDEAHYIKNPKAQVTKCARCLDAGVRFALTGTPIENRLQELWSIFEFLMPGYLGSRDQFAKRFEGPVEAAELEGSSLLRAAIGPFVLRRVKSDVLADLPEKTESVIYCQMGPKQKRLYQASEERLAMQVQHLPDRDLKENKLKVLAELMKLRQICCDPSLYFEDYDDGSAKLDTCVELVCEAVDAGHRVLLFSQFTSMLDIIAARLSAEKVGHMSLTGATSKKERACLVESFQAGESDVFLISLKAGGVGLNLTAADVVIHYDPWWNVAAQDQATDRAYRIGQQRDVTVLKLIAAGTIEERIVAMQEAKRGLAQSVLSGEQVRSALLTREELLAVLGA